MTEQITYTRLPGDPCLSQEQIFHYIDGKLSAAEMFAVEKHLDSCPFCSDALEGLQLVSNREKAASFVPPRTEKKDAEERSSAMVIPLFRRRSTWFAAAASIAVILGVATVMKTSLNQDGESKLAQNTESFSRRTDSLLTLSGAAVSDSAVLKEAPSLDKTVVSAEDISRQQGWTDELIMSPPEPSRSADMPSPDMLEEAKVAETHESYAATTASAAPEETDQSGDRLNKDAEATQAENDKNIETKKAERANRLLKYDRSVKQQTVTAPPVSGGVSRTSLSDEQAPTVTESVTDTVTTNQQGPYPNKATARDLELSYENGVKLLNSGQPTAAIAFFDEVLKDPKHSLYEDAQWKKSEALIRLNRTVEAKALLNEIIQKGGKYKTQAQEKVKTL